MRISREGGDLLVTAERGVGIDAGGDGAAGGNDVLEGGSRIGAWFSPDAGRLGHYGLAQRCIVFAIFILKNIYDRNNVGLSLII